jgi:hypothetical protein
VKKVFKNPLKGLNYLTGWLNRISGPYLKTEEGENERKKDKGKTG